MRRDGPYADHCWHRVKDTEGFGTLFYFCIYLIFSLKKLKKLKSEG